jgi:hypothetical protein
VTREPVERPAESRETASSAWEPPRFQVIALDCEISAYAPDDQPLL